METAKQARCTLRGVQVAVVTGAASGIGLAMAESFAELGLDVVLADIDESHLSRAAALVTDNGGSVLAVRTDVRSAEQVNDLALVTLDHFVRVDVVANNAGVVALGFTWEIEDSEWNWVLGRQSPRCDPRPSGLRPTPHLAKQRPRGEHGVHGGDLGDAGDRAILASKHAVVALSEGLAAEFGSSSPERGVTVVCPGMVDTNILNSGVETPATGRRRISLRAQPA